MAKTAYLVVNASVVGEGVGGGGEPYISSINPTNNNAPDPTALITQAGNCQVLVPTGPGFTINFAVMAAPANSTNAKTVKAASGDSNTGSWTAGPQIYSVTGLTQFYVNSTAANEQILIAWC